MSERPPEKSDGGDSGKGSTSKQEEIAIAINALKREYESSQTQREQHERQSLKWTRRTAKAAIAYTVLTSLLLAAGIYSTIQAIKAVAIAGRQADISEETAKRQLRAYVFIQSVNIKGVDSLTGPETSITIKNSGQTPAYKVTHANAYHWNSYPLTQSLPLAVVPGDDEHSVFELGPGATSQKYKRRPPLNPLFIEGLKIGTTVIYLYGEIRYTDAFNCHRWARYKFILGGPRADRGPNLTAADDGNETSDETAEDCLVKASP